MSSDSATFGLRRLTDSRLPRRLMGILEEPGMIATPITCPITASNYYSTSSELQSSVRTMVTIVGERR